MVSFNQIPNGWKLPLVSIEIDPSQAATPNQPKYALITDYKIAAGTGVADAVIACGSVAQARALGGIGSPLAQAFEKFQAINKSTPVFLLPIAEPGAGVKAAADLVVTNAPTAPGTISLYIAGQKLAIGVTASDTTTTVGTKIAAAVNAKTTLPVVAVASTGTVTLTAKWKGATGNDVRVEENVLGPNGGEVRPTGLAMTFPASNVLTGGTGVPDWTNAIAALGDEPYDFVAMGHTDTGSITAWGTEFGFGDSGRWGWMREVFGQVWSVRRDSYANLISWGPNNNSPVISVEAIEVTSPSPVWEWTAAYAARAAQSIVNDPARPLQTLTLTGILPAPKSSRFSKTELNALAGVGLAIQSTTADGVPMILREQTTYQKNSLGQPDGAYEVATTLATLAEILRRLRLAITGKYPRHKLANDGTRLSPGQAVVTPNIIRAEIVAEYERCEYDGLVENVKAFKAALIVQRNGSDVNRVDVLYPPDLINQLRHLAVLAQFRLQYADAAAA
ncbi:phage tail sheath C-terminal domain-containing protein [Bosea sp. BK604]|uniref:phage tail sheath C-terminal domain-containing protein n=1 Tax=Bosea sp. BK604 TaxID=2512180 RepID=UPI00104A9205|nr:phage tail sheath C-terminal domain-containing protein [Bosea sp. BK604]TCR60943.1 phage tail sheath gpL-like [Bosea sp. BK604]